MAKHAVSSAVCQGNAICPAGCIDACALSQKLKQRYAKEEILIGVYGCPNSCLRAGWCRKKFDLKVCGGQEIFVDAAVCIRCGSCVKKCPSGALALQEGTISLKKEKCLYCGVCEQVCPVCAFTAEAGYLLTNRADHSTHAQFFRKEDELFHSLDQYLGRE